MAKHLFQPGQSGNPKGRPPVFSLTDMIRRKLQEIPPEYKKERKSYADLLVTAVLHKGIIKKDLASLKLIMNYVEGMPKQNLKLEGRVDIPEDPQKLKAIQTALDGLWKEVKKK